jgi:hypothetical protein
MEAVMAGLVPNRKTREELERANSTLLERHREHLRAWVADNAKRDSGEDRSTVAKEKSNCDENRRS